MRFLSRMLLAAFMIIAGVMHFIRPAFFLQIMPPYLPAHRELVFISGVCELLLGLLLLRKRWSRTAAWGVVALLIAVFPANIHLFQNQHLLPAPPLVHLLRLPLQGIFILWALRHTRRQAGYP